MKALIIFSILAISSSFLTAQEANISQKESISSVGTFPVVYRGHLYIQGRADGVKGNFVFDTGASNLYYDSTYYALGDFNYTGFFNAKLPGAGKTPQDVIVIGDTVNFLFGENAYRTPVVPVLQLKPILGDFADGIIGMEYFYKSILEISYEQEYMRLIPSIDSVDLSDFCKIDLIRKGNRLFIPLEVEINDTLTIAGQFQLDFGSGGTISLTSPTKNKYKLFETIDQKTGFFTKYGGVGGESSRYVFRAKSLQIGDFRFDDLTMDFNMDESGAMASDQHLGLLGNGIYERFHVFIDFPNNCLYLKPNGKFTDEFEFSRLGFSYVDRHQTMNSWIVTGLYDGSDAELKGLKIDDKIKSVNGLPVDQISYVMQNDLFNDLKIIRLKVERNNEIIELNFNLKYIQ